jgi:hypothetical protein
VSYDAKGIVDFHELAEFGRRLAGLATGMPMTVNGRM